MNDAAFCPSLRGTKAPFRYSARGLICIDIENSFSFSVVCVYAMLGNSIRTNDQ